jgi:hypothetical protein
VRIDSDQDIFVDVSTAFAIVWEQLFGRPPSSNDLEKQEDQNHQRVVRLLTRALQSGQVTTLYTSLDGRNHSVLTPADASHRAFCINVTRNLITHGHDDDCECDIQTLELQKFLRNRLSKSHYSNVSSETACKDWLVEVMKSRDVKDLTKDKLHAEAMSKFPTLSERGFIRVREIAINESGRSELKEPGRRSGKI